jgi:hypothetical protein
MMTKLFKVLFVIFVITVFPAKAKESFNGIIKYSIVVQSLSEHLSHELLTQTYGAETTVYYGQGLYRIDSEGGDGEWEIYRSDVNKQYLKMKSNPNIDVFDAADENRKIKKFSSKDSDIKTLGRKTKFIEITYADGSISRYWYDPNIYIDPTPFKNLKFAFLNKYWELARSPYLKHERVTNNSVVTYTATSIRETQVPLEMFEPK